MNSKITLIGAACLFGLTAVAAPVSPEQALGRVAGNGPAKVRSMMQSTPKLSYTARDARGTAAAYVFTPSDGVGFTILSADDCAVPVLGYSESGVFDAANMPPAMKWWLEEYGRQIEYAVRKGAKSSDTPVHAPQGWTPVAPLCTTKWNQDAPYNVTTPKVNDRNCPTGCVATSLAQVVNYFKYPEKMSGFASYLWEYGEKTIKMNFENVVFDWSLMLESYTTISPQKNIDAVAQLMKACGYSVQMNYGPDMSGTTSYKIMDALKNNFGYDAGVSYLERARYSTSEWTKMVYDNIKNIGPVIYNGSSIDGGHSFVCDGYDGKGYFHINWGWGGVSDGYYTLELLNPGAQGTGGALGGFNYSQDAVFGIQKPTGKPVETPYLTFFQYGATTLSLDKNVLTMGAKDSDPCGVACSQYRTGSVQPGAILSRVDGKGEDIVIPGRIGSFDSAGFNNIGTYYPTKNAKPNVTLPGDLADGEYKVTLAGKELDAEGATFIPAETLYGTPNYGWLTVKGGQFSVKDATPPALKYESVKIPGSLYWSTSTQSRTMPIDMKIVNDTDLQLTQCLQPVLLSGGALVLASDPFLVCVDAGMTVEAEYPVKFFAKQNASLADGAEYTLALMDRETQQLIGDFGTVVAEKISSVVTVKLVSMDMPDVPKETVTAGDKTFEDAYKLGSTDNIPIDVTYQVTKGYFDSDIIINVNRYDPTTDKEVEYRPGAFMERQFKSEGNEGTVHVDLDLSGIDTDALYVGNAMYLKGAIQVRLGKVYFTFTEGAGVEGVIADETPAMYYDMQGMKVDEPRQGQMLIRVRGGKAEKVLF